MIDQISLNEFADLLPNKARMERDPIFESMLERRDKSLRVTFGEAIDRWFRQYFDVDVKKSRDYVYGEGLKRLGLNPIPKEFRGPPFFGAKMYPDVALIMPDGQFKIAIELEHGNKGSQIRNALAKASFSVILGKYYRALVLFFIDPPKSLDSFQKGTSDEKVLKLYEERFRTTLHLI